MLKAGGREGSTQRSRMRAALVIVQTALATVLLVGATLFVKSLHAVRGLDLGYDVQRLIFISVHPAPGTARLAAERTAAVAADLPKLTERLSHVPGVEGVSLTNTLPMYSFSFSTVFYANGDSLPHWSDGAPGFAAVSPEFFSTAGLRLIRGRGFTAHDRASGDVAIVSETFARLTWPHEEALGKCIRTASPTAPCRTIVGIAQDTRRSQLIEEPIRQLYLPLPRTGPDAWATVMVRTPPERAAAVDLAARREVAALFPGASMSVLRMAEILAPQYRPWELGATLFTVFGLLALIVAAVGVFSTLLQEVGQRVHELGVRAALGATMTDIMRLVVGDGLRVIAVGAVFGTLLALAGGRLIASLLYGVAPYDPVTLVGVAVLLIAVGALASAIPAWRASRADPLEALRAD